MRRRRSLSKRVTFCCYFSIFYSPGPCGKELDWVVRNGQIRANNDSVSDSRLQNYHHIFLVQFHHRELFQLLGQGRSPSSQGTFHQLVSQTSPTVFFWENYPLRFFSWFGRNALVLMVAIFECWWRQMSRSSMRWSSDFAPAPTSIKIFTATESYTISQGIWIICLLGRWHYHSRMLQFQFCFPVVRCKYLHSSPRKNYLEALVPDCHSFILLTNSLIDSNKRYI